MADVSRNSDVGARYAQALFELAEANQAQDGQVQAGQDQGGAQAGDIGRVEADLKGLAALAEDNVDFRRLLASPAFSHEDKGRGLLAVAQAAGVAPLTQKFLGLLAANGRAAALPAVSTAFTRLAAERRGAVAAEVVSAIALTPAQAEGVAAALRQWLGKAPEITTRVDPAILGGLKVRVGSRLYDTSLKSRLDAMRFALKRA